MGLPYQNGDCFVNFLFLWDEFTIVYDLYESVIFIVHNSLFIAKLVGFW